MGSELPLSVAFSKVEARSLVADAAVKVAVLSALRGLLVEASDETFAGALSLEPSPGAVTVAPFAQTRLKRPAGADASAWAAREAELAMERAGQSALDEAKEAGKERARQEAEAARAEVQELVRREAALQAQLAGTLAGTQAERRARAQQRSTAE